MILEFDHVSFCYPGEETGILEDLSFSVRRGEFTTLIGASGSGKSTIFRLINGFHPPDRGTIRLNEDSRKGTKMRCGYMPQHDLLFPWNTVWENVALPLRVQKIPAKERRRRAGELIARVGLAGCEDRYPKELSGGMRQRAAFARTLATGSGLLLLDEPFSALDSITRADMQEWMQEQWSDLDRTIIMITHDVEEAIYLSERILVLTGRPVKKFVEIRVPLPKQRKREMLLSGEVLQLKETLMTLLHGETERTKS